jgi:hypothetical protein
MLRFATLAVAAALLTRPPQHQPDVRYVPTPQQVVDAMLEFVHVGPADVVFDLGSGDGRIPITAAEKFGARGVGIEIDPLLVRQAEGNRERSPARDRVTFITGDLFEADLRGATVVTLFLYPWMNERLIPKFRVELTRGARIVSHHFDLGPSWPAEESRDVNGLMIYRWTNR